MCNSIQEKKSMQRHPSCITDADDYYILDYINCRNKIEFERTVSGNNENEQY